MRYRPDHRVLVRLAIIAFGVGVLLGGCGKDDAKQQQTPLPEVGVITIHSQSVTLTTDLPGRTSPFAVSDVRPQVDGIIQHLLFQQGSEVAAGQTLYQIDPTAYQAAYDSAAAALASARASLTSAKTLAERDAQLVKSNAISKQDNDNAQAAYEQAKANVQQQQANVESARINLEHTQLRAPIAGRVGISTVTQGALVTANQTTALTTIQQLDPIYVDVAQSSTQLLELKKALLGGKLKDANAVTADVSLQLEDGTKYASQGKMQFTDVTVDPSTGAVTLRAIFPNPDHLLLPGMSVRETVVEGVDPNAILAPQQGIIRDTKGDPTAWVVGGDNKVELRNLKVSRAIGNNWLVTDGLKDGDRVIVEGTQKAHPGVAVRPVPADLDHPQPTSADKSQSGG